MSSKFGGYETAGENESTPTLSIIDGQWSHSMENGKQKKNVGTVIDVSLLKKSLYISYITIKFNLGLKLLPKDDYTTLYGQSKNIFTDFSQ